MWTDDPFADFIRHDAYQDRRLRMLPTCAQCGEHIQQEDAVFVKGGYICDRCLDDLRVDLMWGDANE